MNMKKRNRLLSAFLALCLLLSLTPMEVLAQEPAQAEEQLLAEAVLLEEPEAPADDIPADAPEADISPLADTEIVLSGTCGAEGDGSNLRWEFDLDKRTFTITGSGAMKDYAHASAMPWYSAAYNHRNDEDRFDIIVGEGITSIGNYAFSCFSYSGIASLSLPSTLEKNWRVCM